MNSPAVTARNKRTSRKASAGPKRGQDPQRRPYASPLRKQQMEQTRELIVEALAEQVWKEGLADFSVPKVAKRAGVSTRTVYRYFPTRDDLIDAVGEWVRTHAPEPDPPRGLDDLIRYVRDLHAYFDSHPQLVELQALPGLGRELQERWRAERLAEATSMLPRWLPEIDDERERLRRFAPIRVLMGSRSWLQLTRELGLSSSEATDVVCEAIDTLIQAHREEAGHARR